YCGAGTFGTGQANANVSGQGHGSRTPDRGGMKGASHVTFVLLVGVLCHLLITLKRRLRRQRFERGRQLGKQRRSAAPGNGLRWGPFVLPESTATQHFLAAGTTGSGKSLVQKLLMRGMLPKITAGTDTRALILDAKNDISAFLKHVG